MDALAMDSALVEGSRTRGLTAKLLGEARRGKAIAGRARERRADMLLRIGR